MINVTCAIIRNEENQILIVQRGESTDHPYKWEFPGGKLDEKETEDECIIREIDEELSMEIVIAGKLPSVEHDYVSKQIRLIPFICDTLDEVPYLSEHIAFKWVEEEDLLSADFSAADVFVAKSYLQLTGDKKKEEDKVVNKPDETSDIDSYLQSFVTGMMNVKEAEWIASSAIDNPVIFQKLFEYSLSADNKLAFRASWTLTKVCDKIPEIIYPYLGDIVESLGRVANESTLRSFLRILSHSDMGQINIYQHGLLADFSFNTLNSGFSSIAVKAFSMEIIYKLSLIYPELANELSTSIRLLMVEGSAGITARGKMILKKLAGRPVKPGQL